MLCDVFVELCGRKLGNIFAISEDGQVIKLAASVCEFSRSYNIHECLLRSVALILSCGLRPRLRPGGCCPQITHEMQKAVVCGKLYISASA